MTAMVVLDANLPMDEMISITEAEIDRLKGTSSRLAVGTTLSRREMLLLALMSVKTALQQRWHGLSPVERMPLLRA